MLQMIDIQTILQPIFLYPFN